MYYVRVQVQGHTGVRRVYDTTNFYYRQYARHIRLVELLLIFIASHSELSCGNKTFLQ